MKIRLQHVVLAVAAVSVFALGVGYGSRPQAQESAESEEDDVSEQELERYIEVYKAMQADHGLTIDEALTERGMELGEFRALEQRIQHQDGLVRRVREALLEYAKSRGGQPMPPGESAAAETTKR
jgi:hypothetical protein